jgi:alanine racemase
MTAPGTPVDVERAAVIDTLAIEENARRFVELARPAQVMAVVKADGYGHGAVETARAAIRGGATWLGVAHISEAIALREARITEPILAWLHTPASAFRAAIEKDITLAVSGPELEQLAAAARESGTAARLHVKVDTGLGRNGAGTGALDGLVARLSALQAEGSVVVDGAMTHLAVADDPSRRAETDAQRDAFLAAIDVLERAGISPALRHVANTAATLSRPDLHFDLVRVGIGLYGLDPFAGGGDGTVGLRPAMSVRTRLSHIKTLPPGHGVSYGYDYVSEAAVTVGLVPLGYADGVPRGSRGAGVTIGGRAFPVIGRIAMDQLVVDLTRASLDLDDRPRVGDVVELFGPGGTTADDWARAAGTINYEIVTRIGPRVPRLYVAGDGARPRRMGVDPPTPTRRFG